MKKITLTICAASFILFSCENNPADKIEKTDSTQQATADAPPMDSAAMMKAWESYMTPGQEQATLASSNGTWNQEVTMWMDPNKPPTVNSSTAVNSMILDGRYQQSVSKGNFMGMPFEGISVTGFDNARKVYQTTWIDNMGTGIMHMEGKWDDATKSIEFKGKATDPSTGKEMDVREVFKVVDDNTQTMEMYCVQNGKEMKTMAIKSTRKK